MKRAAFYIFALLVCAGLASVVWLFAFDHPHFTVTVALVGDIKQSYDVSGQVPISGNGDHEFKIAELAEAPTGNWLKMDQFGSWGLESHPKGYSHNNTTGNQRGFGFGIVRAGKSDPVQLISVTLPFWGIHNQSAVCFKELPVPILLKLNTAYKVELFGKGSAVEEIVVREGSVYFLKK